MQLTTLFTQSQDVAFVDRFESAVQAKGSWSWNFPKKPKKGKADQLIHVDAFTVLVVTFDDR